MKTVAIPKITEALKRAQDPDLILSKLYKMSTDYQDIENPDILELVPVKIVSCFEEYFRQLYQDIIDEMEDKALLKDIKCLKDMKFDFDLIAAISKKNVTLGECLSYSFPCNKFSDIENNFTDLLKINFIEELKKRIKPDFDNTVSEEELETKARNDIASIDKIFKMRHIICHEGGLGYSLDKDSVQTIIEDAINFVTNVSEVYRIIMYPMEPITQYDMNESGQKEFEKIQNELDSIVEIINKKKSAVDLPNDLSYLEEWEQYRENRAKIQASQYEGGTIYPLVCFSSKIETTMSMINELKTKYRKLLLFS